MEPSICVVTPLTVTVVERVPLRPSSVPRTIQTLRNSIVSTLSELCSAHSEIVVVEKKGGRPSRQAVPTLQVRYLLRDDGSLPPHFRPTLRDGHLSGASRE